MKPTVTQALLTLLILTSTAFSQGLEIPSRCSTTHPSGSADGTYTVPYSYRQVQTIIGSFENITWAYGYPPNLVTLNGTDNKVGTARTYRSAGQFLSVETLLNYSNPSSGPYVQITNLYYVPLPIINSTNGTNFQVYSNHNALTVTSTCDGRAVEFAFEIDFCANDTDAAEVYWENSFRNQALNVSRLLGGRQFTSCADLAAANSAGGGLAAGVDLWWMLGLVAAGAVFVLG